MAAIGSFTGPTAGANWISGFGIFQIDTFGIDRLVGVSDLAAEADSDCAWTAKKRAGREADGSRDAQVFRSLGSGCELNQDAAGLRERLVYVLQRARAAETGKLESGCATALQHVSGDIDLQEIEGDTRRGAPL